MICSTCHKLIEDGAAYIDDPIQGFVHVGCYQIKAGAPVPTFFERAKAAVKSAFTAS